MTQKNSSSRQTAHKRGSKYANRRGLTFLEAILAVVLLSMVTITLASAVSFMTQSQRRMDQKLGAAELANRLVLQYMDERNSLPDRALPIEYDRDTYRWTLEEAPVKFEFDNQTEEESGGFGGGVSLNRIKLITIKVWLGADSGGSRSFTPTVPNMVITRLIDPLAFNNPDSLETLLQKPGGIEQLFESLLELEGGG
jgi:type II secretory pathway pseudopilin PulG